MGRRAILAGRVRRLGRTILRKLVFSLPEDFWKDIQDTAPDVAIYEIASLMRVVGKDDADEKARSYIRFSQAYDDWLRATRWTAAVKAADEAARDQSAESTARSRRKRALSHPRGEARDNDDGDDKGMDRERHQGRITPEYLERRARELGL
ncbi:MAG: hypothetical protein M3Z49_12950 [Bifidobacteriales bacterium]|nr:hypothetical protein [Bifidobacteriales bacterium]MCT6920112.1 hypothetical protein [Bifidobacteriales bacterium]